MVKLVRIDDRLIHGQVVLGWGRVLNPDRYVVIDDEVATTDWERSLYSSAVQDGTAVSILTVEEAVAKFRSGAFDGEDVVILVKSPQTMLRLVSGGFEAQEVNVGGLHFSEGKEKLLENVYVDDSEKGALRELVKKGITLEARALPESEKVILNSLVV